MYKFTHGEIDVFRFPLLPFYKDFVFYLYCVDGLLIDTGPRLRKSILAHEFKELPIKKVALTHHHDDHMGMAGWLWRNKKPEIYTHKNTIPHIKKQKHLPWIYRVGRKHAGQFDAVTYPEKITTNNYEFINQTKNGCLQVTYILHRIPKSRISQNQLFNILIHSKKL